MRLRFILSVLLLQAMSSVFSLNADLVTIVHPDVSADSVAPTTLERMYLGKTKKWQDGTKVVPVTLKAQGALHTYIHSHFKQSPSQFSTYWKRRIFSGRGSPPRAFKHIPDVVEFVARTPGAIGFIPEESMDEAVKLIEVHN